VNNSRSTYFLLLPVNFKNVFKELSQSQVDLKSWCGRNEASCESSTLQRPVFLVPDFNDEGLQDFSFSSFNAQNLKTKAAERLSCQRQDHMLFTRATTEFGSAVLCGVPTLKQPPAFERQQGIYCLQLSCTGSLAADSKP
jgi:hypothetical protein